MTKKQKLRAEQLKQMLVMMMYDERHLAYRLLCVDNSPKTKKQMIAYLRYQNGTVFHSDGKAYSHIGRLRAMKLVIQTGDSHGHAQKWCMNVKENNLYNKVLKLIQDDSKST